MEAAFKLIPLTDNRSTFDLAPSDRQIERSSIPFIWAAREGASKLRGKARLIPTLIGTQEASLIRLLLRLEQRGHFFHRWNWHIGKLRGGYTKRTLQRGVLQHDVQKDASR